MAEQIATVTFKKERTTPGTVVFKETGAPEFHKIGTLYVKKRAFNAPEHEFPDTIKITIERA